MAFHRWDHGDPGDDVIVVANFSSRGYPDYRVGFPRPGRWRVRFNGDWDGYGPAFTGFASFDTHATDGGQGGMPASGSVGVGPYTTVILSQDRS